MDYIENYKLAKNCLDERAKFIVNNIVNLNDAPYYLPNQFKLIVDENMIYFYPSRSDDHGTCSFCHMSFKDFNDGKKWRIKSSKPYIFKISKVKDK
jgi:hypothetical protein